MRKFIGHAIGLEQGEVVLFSDFQDDGPMWRGEGEREVVKSVEFSEKYDDAPAVTLAIAMCDMSNDAYMRFDMCAVDVTAQGFKIRFSTWGDTKIARVRVHWQSIGSVNNEDAWDI